MAINRDKVNAAASKLLQQGKYDKAIAELNRLVDDDPKDVRTLLKLGDTYVKVGKKNSAIQSYQRVANIYSDQGFYLKAVAVFKQMLRVDSKLPEVHLQLAEMYQQLGLHSDSMQHFQQVAVFYEQQGRSDEALGVLKKMVDLDPDNLPSRIKLAELFAQQGRSAEAVQEFRSAADYLKSQERMDDFVRVAERLVYFDPSAIEVTRELADIYLERGEHKLALGKLQICFKADPRNVDTLGLIAQAFMGMQQIPKTISVYKEMARIYESQGRVVDAEQCWHQVKALAPDDAEMLQALGLAATAAPSPSPAPTPAPRAAAPAAPAVPPGPPPHPDADQIARLLTETDVYLKYGLKNKALEHLQKVFALDPDHIDAHEKLRDVYQQLGDRQALIRELRVLVELGGQQGDPRLPGWQQELAGLNQPPPLEADEEEFGGELLIDPMVSDEPLDGMSPGLTLPPDEGPIGMDDDAIQLTDEAVSSDLSEEFILDEDSVIEMAEIHEVDDDVQSIDYAAAIPSRPPTAPHTNISYSEDSLDDELAAAASAAVEALEGDFEFADELSAAEVEPEPAVDPPASPRAPSQAGLDQLPPEFSAPDLPDGAQLPDAYAATEIMSLSPTDLEEMRAFVADAKRRGPSPGPKTEAPLTPAQQVPAGLDLAADEGFGEATLAMAMEGGYQASSAAGPGALTPEEEAEADAILAEASAFENGFSYADRSSDMGAPLESASGEAASPAAEMSLDDHAAGFEDGDPLEPMGDDDPFAGVGDDDLDAMLDGATVGADRVAAFEDDLGVPDLPEPFPPEEEPATSGSDPFAPQTTAAQPMVPADESMAQKLGTTDAARGFEDDIAASFFPDELEEAEFFIKQGILDEAKEILDEIVDSLPDESPRVSHMLARIAAQEAGEPEPPAPWEQDLIQSVQEEIGDMDLEAWGEEMSAVTEQVSVDEVLSQFKEGVKKQVDENDAETHYSLGIAYREMGLYDDAVGEFEIATRVAQKAPDAFHLIGLTRADQGRPDEALAAFDNALEFNHLAPKPRAANEYHRGLCLAQLGRHHDALEAFTRARDLGTDLPDVEMHLQQAKDRAGANGHGGSSSHRAPLSDESERRKKNIDYL